jgi:hypothetical protein
MSDPGSLLATLAQSSAAVVAIVGGFLVSRLVQLSSEREGLRRRLADAQDELRHVTTSYDEAHERRLDNSKYAFYQGVLDDLLQRDLATLDRGPYLAAHVPLGSSEEEMAPYLDFLIGLVTEDKAHVRKYVRSSDNDSLDLDVLRGRGLVVPGDREAVYQRMVDLIADQRPPSGPFRSTVPPSVLRGSGITGISTQAAELRRLDESIRDEQDQRARKAMLEAEVARVTEEIGRIGRPVGVTSAIAILAVYSVLGIVAPVVVMGLGWPSLAAWLEWLLVGLFTAGLFAVLAYIFWYAKTLNDPIQRRQPSAGSEMIAGDGT